MDNYNRELENNLLEMIKQKEQADKRLLTIEIVMGIICLIPLMAAVVLVAVMPLEEWMKSIILISGIIPLLTATPFAIRIEQKAGSYECQKCGHRHIPQYSNVLFAMHINRTRYMRCPKCEKTSWQKKVISKE